MSWGYDYYEDRSAEKAAAEKQLAKRRKAGEALEPVVPLTKRDISSTFWGQAWNLNLMAYADYESRMPRGRTYVRGGKVLGLQIQPGKITSTVHGTSLYEVSISIKPLDPEAWAKLRADCAGQISTLVELLSGKLSDAVMRRVTDLSDGLFPGAREIKLGCTCPDWADCCKHAAATLYAVSVRLDQQPDLLFTLRGVDATQLIETSSTAAAVEQLTGQPEVSGDLAGEDLSALFGIDLGEAEAAAAIFEAMPALAAPAEQTAKKEAKPPTAKTMAAKQPPTKLAAKPSAKPNSKKAAKQAKPS